MTDAASPITPSPTRRLCLEIAYDGSDYHGWQYQDGFSTIQGAIQIAIARLLGHHANLLSCGRTDAGVHALKQVATFATASTWEPDRVTRGLNATLPHAIRIRNTREVPWQFHPINDVVAKRYRYLIDDGRPTMPLLRRYCWAHRKPLDVDAMRAAAQYLVGTHDFAAFQSQGSPRESTVRTIVELTVRREVSLGFWGQHTGGQDHPLIVIEVEADGFLYNMVRAIVGTLALIGSHQTCRASSRGFGISPDWIRYVLNRGDRTIAGQTAPAHGLYMLDVRFKGA